MSQYVICAKGAEFWYQDGKLHKINGPAVVYSDGEKRWYQNGVLHRIDGPAIVSADGSQHWYRNGMLHRTDGPAVVEPDGTQHWYQNGKRCRADGPVIVYGKHGSGKRHRDDGSTISMLAMSFFVISLTIMILAGGLVVLITGG